MCCRFLIVLILSVYANAGTADSNFKVDQIFAAFNKPDSPGCSLGVIQNNNFVYRKSYGMGSLELGVPLSTDSVFYVGSLSKQFTAAAVVLAAEEGYLKLDDDVHKYIPELPDYGRAVTLRQMLHHTSGFRDFLGLIYLSGRDPLDFNSPEEILKLIVRQKALNNIPGDEFVYSNTNYFLLGLVIQRATKKSLAEFAAEKIFQPLGMLSTRFYDDHRLVVPGRVSAYDSGPNGGFLADWSTTYAVVGGGGLMTTVNDLLLWGRNFYANRLGKGTLIKELQTRGVLNNGKEISYALGLNLKTYRGSPIVEHNGALFGYRADLLRFPEQKFAVACLCNISNADPETMSRKVADLYLTNLQPVPSAEARRDSTLPDPVRFAGKYLDSRTHTIYSFTASRGELEAWGGALKRINVNQFYDLEGNVITFTESATAMSAKLDVAGQTYFSGEKVESPRLNSRDLESYAGRFTSPELDATYDIFLKDGALLLRVGESQPRDLVPITRDEFEAVQFGTLVFTRDGGERVKGLAVFTPEVRGVQLAKDK